MKRLAVGLPGWSLGYAIVLEMMLVAAILYWPNFEENIGALRILAAPIPAMRVLLEQVESFGVVGYVSGQHFFKGCNTMGAAAAVLFAVGAVAGEARRGTLEIWMARPFSRLRMLSERYAAGAVALAFPIFATSATIPWLCGFVDESVPLWAMMLSSVHQWIFLMTIYSATFLASTRGSHPTRISLAAIFSVTFLFAMYMVEVVTNYSFFRLADIEDHMFIFEHATLDWPIIALLVAISAALFWLSLRSFQRRIP